MLLLALLLVSQQPPTFQTTSEEVVLDLIVRDKRGRQVRDLKPGEITILENGVPQTLKSFRLLEGAEYLEFALQSPSDPERRRLDPLRSLRLITIACDRLGLDARRLTGQAVADLMKQPVPPNTYYSVVSLNPEFKIVQPYTADPILVRWAVDRATGGSVQSLPPSSPTPSSELPASDPIQRRLQEIVANMEKRVEEFERERQGSHSLNALLSLALSLRLVEGRKTVFLFSEGMPIHPAQMSMFQAVTGQANRSNVAFYSIDARGLAAGTPNALSAMPGAEGLATLDVEDAASNQASRNGQRQIEDLAVSTGGFLISAANDLRAPLRRAAEDASTYYLASFSPAEKNWDGRFRSLEVRVTRPGLAVQSRSGYFALPPGMQTLLFPHEVPLLKALSATPAPRQIDYRAAMFRFQPAPKGRVQCAFHIEIPLKNLTVRKDPASASYQTHVSFLVLIKDPSGTPVRKATRDVPFSGPIDKLDQFLNGNFVYGDWFPLIPGRYTMESAILDRTGEQVSTRRIAFVVPPPAAQDLSLSDIVLVRRADPNPPPEIKYGPEDDRGPDPFRGPGGKITPSLDTTIPAGPAAFYFTASSSGPIEAVMEFLRDGQLISRSPIQLPPPGPGGRIPYLATADLSPLKPGDYEVRITIRRGATSVISTLGFTVE